MSITFRLTSIILSAYFILIPCTKADAKELPIKTVLTNSFYGGLIGGVLGAAALAFTDEPKDNMDFISKGAAYGVFAGTAFGLYELNSYFVTIDNEKGNMNAKLMMPSITYDVKILPENRTDHRLFVPVLKYNF